MKITLFLIVSILVLLSSLKTHSQENDSAATIDSNGTSSHSKPNMTEMFGPDYKKGDIGHSTGIIELITTDGDLVIDHAKIHGTSIEAATTGFEVLNSADISNLAGGDYVEFLIKKDHDDVYRLLSVCKMTTSSAKCL